MQIIGVDHVTIRVRPEDVEAMRAFYADVLGLRVGKRLLSFPGVWLYLGDQALVHVAGNVAAGQAVGVGAGAGEIGFDHMAFRSAGIRSAKNRLDGAGIAWREVWRPHLDILQLVLADPMGTKVELTFDPAEYARDPAGDISDQKQSC